MLKTVSTSIADQIINGLTSGVLAIGPRDEILAANSAASTHLGLPPAALKPGTPLASIESLYPLLEIVRGVSLTRTPVLRQEVMFRPNPNQLRELGLSIALLEGPADYNGVIVLFTDMTDRRKLERAASVNRQLASLGELAAGVVHQLRNPLTIISGRAQMLARKLKDDSKTEESLNAIRDECTRMSDSISRFLAFAKPFEMKPGPTSADAVIQRAVDLNRKKADDAQIELITRTDSGVRMWIDQLRLAEALANVVDNAIDAVQSDGVVEIRVAQSGENTIFDVLDSGPGLDLEPDEDLLSPFLTKKHDGTGLGLSVVQRIVSAQGGTVTYGNRDEGGAWFRITVPTEQRASFEDG